MLFQTQLDFPHRLTIMRNERYQGWCSRPFPGRAPSTRPTHGMPTHHISLKSDLLDLGATICSFCRVPPHPDSGLTSGPPTTTTARSGVREDSGLPPTSTCTIVRAGWRCRFSPFCYISVPALRKTVSDSRERHTRPFLHLPILRLYEFRLILTKLDLR